jgi:hypothetical protein
MLSAGIDRNAREVSKVNRRALIVAGVGALSSRLLNAQQAVTQPVVTEAIAPVEVIAPVAEDGHRGLGVLRKPPGNGPFPAVIYLHGGITTIPLANLRATATQGANPSRLLAAGFVVIVPTYRSRDVDPQSPMGELLHSVALVNSTSGSSLRSHSKRISCWHPASMVFGLM